jgi:predicted DNA-binding protein with PD1-like motif
MKVREVEGGFLVRIDKGEEILSTLTAWARERGIGSGALEGIGAIENARLGFFDIKRKEYETKELEGEYELVSLTGNISLVDGQPFVHAHCVLGRADCSLIGGHLFCATVAAAGEFFVRPFAEPMQRELNRDIGLKLLVI